MRLQLARATDFHINLRKLVQDVEANNLKTNKPDSIDSAREFRERFKGLFTGDQLSYDWNNHGDIHKKIPRLHLLQNPEHVKVHIIPAETFNKNGTNTFDTGDQDAVPPFLRRSSITGKSNQLSKRSKKISQMTQGSIGDGDQTKKKSNLFDAFVKKYNDCVEFTEPQKNEDGWLDGNWVLQDTTIKSEAESVVFHDIQDMIKLPYIKDHFKMRKSPHYDTLLELSKRSKQLSADEYNKMRVILEDEGII